MSYDCNLLKCGYSVKYVSDGCRCKFFGVSTVEKQILLYNVKPEDRVSVDFFLLQADLAYAVEWKK